MTVDAIVAECYGCLSVVYYNNNTSAILLLGKTLFAFSFFVHYVFIVGEEWMPVVFLYPWALFPVGWDLVYNFRIIAYRNTFS